MVLYWNSSPIPQVKKFLHFDLTVTNGIPTPDFDQIEFDVQQGNKVGPAIILGILERSSMVPKLYIPSTINIWKKVLTKAIWAGKKWAGFWQISLYIK